jgi:SAM-dependent methyltransferase
MTSAAATPSSQPSAGRAQAYALGRSDHEHERLTQQAMLLRGMTGRLLAAAGLVPGMRILDVGSGTGDVAFLAAELVGPRGAVVGVDVDGAALATARARAERLGLRNVGFVEGNVATAALGDDFDAAVGRLVLMHLDDPAQVLRTVAAQVRAGGAIAFQELDLDPGTSARSLPGGTLWDETGRLVIETFVRAGVHARMGRHLHATFVAAGLPAPAMSEEALVGGGPDFPGYQWLAGVAGSLAPLAQRLGLATIETLDLDTLAERIRDDAVATGAVVWSPPLIGAHARIPVPEQEA